MPHAHDFIQNFLKDIEENSIIETKREREKGRNWRNCKNFNRCRDITLPTKVRLVKAMVFPVVMYGCESWTVKKAERQRIDAFELWC